MSSLQVVLLSLASDVSRSCRVPGGPIFALDREPSPRKIVRWLRWNDRNGDYPADCDSLDDAWAWLEAALRDELSPFA
jgi:hypothetical protein